MEILLPTGNESTGIKDIKALVSQYRMGIVVGKQTREVTLEALRGDVYE